MRSKCKVCVNADNNNRRQKNPDSYRQKNLQYYYDNKEKLNAERRANWPKLYQDNIEYQRQKGQKYRAENPHKVREFARRRRALKRSNGAERYSEAQVLKLHGSMCHLCKVEIDLSLNRKVGAEGWRMSLQIDHVIPLSKGGPDTLANVKPSHAKCNMDKGNKLN